MTASERYVRRIKNARKRAYAHAYLRHLEERAPEPQCPFGLSFMAAQAVRLRLHDLVAARSSVARKEAR